MKTRFADVRFSLCDVSVSIESTKQQGCGPESASTSCHDKDGFVIGFGEVIQDLLSDWKWTFAINAMKRYSLFIQIVPD